MSIFFYKRLLGTDAINSLLFFKDVFFSLIEKGPGNKDIHLLSSKLNVKNATHTFLELGTAWAKEISHQTLDTELSDLARPMAGGRAPWRPAVFSPWDKLGLMPPAETEAKMLQVCPLWTKS